MRKTKRRVLYIFAALLGVVFVLACLAGFAACGGDDGNNGESGEHTTHTWDAGVVVDPTCTEKGYTLQTCTVCGETQKVSETDALGHDYQPDEESSANAAATCTTNGTQALKCSRCGATTTETIAALGHDLTTTTVDATCTTAGSVTETCSRGDYTNTTTTSAPLGHELVGTYTAGESGAVGTWTYTCAREDGAAVSSVDSSTPVASVTLKATDEESLKAAVAWNVVSDAELTVVLDADVEEAANEVPGAGTPTALDEVVTEDEDDEDDETLPTISLTSAAVEISQAVTLDLNGNVLSTSGQGGKDFNTITVKEGGSLTIVDSKADETTGIGTGKIANTYPRQSTQPAANNAAAIYTSGDVVIKSGVIDSTSVGIHAVNGSVVIDGGVVYSSQYYSIWEGDGKVNVTINDGIVAGDVQCILVDGDSNFGHGGYYSFNAVTNLTVNGGVVYSGGLLQGAIRTESMTSAKSAKITINDGTIFCGDNKGKVTMSGQVDSLTQSAYKNEPAIFMGNGTLEVNGGTITGPTALEVQAGKTAISGGTFTSSYEGEQNMDPTVGSSDPYTYGYALAIYPRGYIARTTDSTSVADGFSMATDVTVSGGTFDGDVYISQKNYATQGVGEWTLNTADAEGVTNYKVSISNVELSLIAYTEAELDWAVTVDGATVKLGQDITVSSTVTIDTTITLDLNGKTLTTGENKAVNLHTITVTESGVLTIEDSTACPETGVGSGQIVNTLTPISGTSYALNNAAAIYTSGKVVIKSGVINSGFVGIHAVNGSVVICGGLVYSSSYYAIWEGDGQVDVTLNAGIVASGYGGILVDGDSNFGHGGYYSFNAVTTLTVNGGVIYSGGSDQGAIRTENMTSVKSATITINDGLIICGDNGSTKNESAIFLANGTLIVKGGTIVGPTALEIQGGVATIEGGTFIAKYGENDATQNTNTTNKSSDPFTYGYALAIYPRGDIGRSTDADSVADGFTTAVSVTISGGTFVGDVYVANKLYNTSSTGNWALSWTANAEDADNPSNYVVVIDGEKVDITLAAVDANGEPISDDNNESIADHYIWSYEADSGDGDDEQQDG